MKYLGGKQRIKKQLVDFMLPFALRCDRIIEPFCGACAITEELAPRARKPYFASDAHAALITMWQAVQGGWIPPRSVSKEQAAWYKDNGPDNDPLTAFIGFGCRYSGVFNGGFVGRKPYHSLNNIGQRINRRGAIVQLDFTMTASNAIRHSSTKIKQVKFTNCKYDDVVIEPNSFVYCDPPYAGTSGYSVGAFDHDKFWQWVRDQSTHSLVLVSEYTAPDDFKSVHQISKRRNLGTVQSNGLCGKIMTIENLFATQEVAARLESITNSLKCSR